jgi:micrococcal nuclease
MPKTLLLFSFSFFFLSAISQTIPAGEVKNNVGKIVTVSGKVVSGSHLSSAYKQPTLLNIDKPFPNEIFTVVIYGENRKAFGYNPEEVLLGKDISVTGKVTMYYGKPQVEVVKPEQIVFATAAIKPVIVKDAKALTTGEVVLKSTVKLKSGPGVDYKDILKLKPGSIIKVVYTEEGWCYVSVTKNQGKENLNQPMTGFIKSDELK